MYDSQPHFTKPLVAPRPQKLMSSVPAEMARTLEQQFPGTPAPPGLAYGQQVPSISFNNQQPPGSYPMAGQPGGMQGQPGGMQGQPGGMQNMNINMQGGYQGNAYSQGYIQNPAFPLRTATASPLPYPGTPQPYQQQQQQPLSYTGLPPAGFAMQPMRMTPSPAPGPPPALTNPVGPNLAPGFTGRPQSWGGAPTPSPGPGLIARPLSGFGPGPAQPQSLQQSLQALSVVGIQAPPPNPYWINGATPPVSRPASASPANPSATRYNIDNSVAGLTFNDPAPSKPTAPPQLTVTLPTLATLSSSMGSVLASRDAGSKVAWCKDVLSALDRAIQANGSNLGDGPAIELLKGSGGPAGGISEPDIALLKLSDAAVATLIQMLKPPLPIGPNNSMPPFIAEGLFLRGQVISAGTFPEVLPKSPRDAFRDFEASARGGYAPAWFKLGRDYETVGDLVRAKDCFEKGLQRGVGSCFYRMGMAYLQGQLNLPQNPSIAMPLLHHAAYLSSIEVPQPAYVYALLLVQEFPHVTLPQHLLQSLVPQAHPVPVSNPAIPPPSLMSESRKYLERSAYLNFGPALYKLGQSYEHALPPFPYDPLMSVQYYSLASQTGNALADLALSKWFLVGSKPDPADPNAPNAPAESFEKDESLALIFAEKAAMKGEAGGEFAMGYYSEVGVGRPRDMVEAKRWYERAAKQGHQDAKERLKELARENPRLLTTQEHQGRLERMRTNAKERMKASESSGGVVGSGGLAPPLPGQPASNGMLAPSGANVMALARNSSRMNHGGAGRRAKIQDFEAAAAGHGPEKVTASPPVKPVGLVPSAAATSSSSPPIAAKPAAAGAGAKTKPTTFEEMGYHSQKLEDKECIIM
ncbi:hypothetical protein M408DRAFT_333222 [Serendipita vermifera MAFF 305830]|uniref:HCP-like protein n=1 Tax=Serendipita vermifera MAFF 305830 TaxID=933852 RepID=A0A0C3AB22_SERVB|nr:hypothetical protein M408DRAFT_333222 [Serendipita vermifera MAFF 305830]